MLLVPGTVCLMYFTTWCLFERLISFLEGLLAASLVGTVYNERGSEELGRVWAGRGVIIYSVGYLATGEFEPSGVPGALVSPAGEQ